MHTAINIELLRSISSSLGRFLAITGIVALGCGFYSGLRMTSPDMKLSADEYYDATSLMDIRVVSTLGLTDEDVAALREVPGVEEVAGAYETDVMADMAGEQYVVRVHSLSSSAITSDTSDGLHAYSSDTNYLNRLILTEGSWPEKAGECVLASDLPISKGVQIGDSIVCTDSTQDLDDTLTTDTFTVVGKVRSSYYVTSSSMGITSLGGGLIQEWMYVLEDSFSDDLPYTEAFITVAGAADLFSSSDEYQTLIDEVSERINAIAPEREQARVDGLRDDAQAELDEATADYEQAKADAESKLSDAWDQLSEAKDQLDSSKSQLEDAKSELDAARAQLSDAQSQLQSAQDQISSSEQEISEGWDEYENGLAALDQERESALSEINAAQQQINSSRDAYTSALAQREQLNQQLDAAQSGLDQAQSGLSEVEGGILQAQAALAQLDAALHSLDPADEGYEEQLSALNAQKAAVQQNQDFLQEQKGVLESTIAEVESGIEQLQAGIAQIDSQTSGVADTLDAAQSELDAQSSSAQDQLSSAQAQLDDAKSQLEEGQSQLNDAKQSYTDALNEYNSGLAQYREGHAQYEEGLSQYNDGKAEYEDGLAGYWENYDEAQEGLAEAKSEIDDAQKLIDELENPEWLVMDRTTNYGVVSFESDADRVDNIAQVFPLIFFLVAALVALTTMTRMVEEERVLIGTFKALGYSRRRITAKYLIYAAIASIAGSVLGVLILSQALPSIIVRAYSVIYFLPYLPLPLPINIPLALLSILLGVGVSLFATWAAITATLRESPASLMLPRTPKAGKRILLERITPLWRRLSFSWKVTCRNLFRYKKRLAMTVIGIAGCTGLLLTGLGLSDSINDIIDKQYMEILHYNTQITLSDDADELSFAAVEDILDEDQAVSGHMRALHENLLASGPDEEDRRFELIVPEHASKLSEFVTLRTREGHDVLELTDDGFVLSEKLADVLGVSIGDYVTLTEQDDIGNPTDTSYEARVSAITENYIYYYAYMGPELFESITASKLDPTSVYATTSDDVSQRANLSDTLRDNVPQVKTVSFNDETIETYRNMLNSVNMVVVVLVIAAAALAFIVLYNLTNINICERAREIATLKVLGFRSGEVRWYIYRETLLLSIIGALLGCAFGVVLEGFVIVTAEVDQVMFGREIHAMSFVIACVLTLFFTVCVMTFMRHKVTAINMVESLKSVE